MEEKVEESTENNNSEKVEESMENNNSEKVVTGKVECVICHKLFNRNRRLYQHLRKVHKKEPDKKATLLCPLNKCSHLSSNFSELREHLLIKHGKEVEKEEYLFKNRTDFLRWKESLAKTDKVSYNCRSSRAGPNGNKSYYSCHRSHCKYKPKAEKDLVRAPKYKICSKMMVTCPSSMVVVETEDEVHVIHYKTHIGHGVDVKDLTLNTEIPNNEAGDILFNDLLKGVNVNLTNEGVLPMAARKREVRLLKEAFESEDYNTGLSDSESVNRWVDQCMQMEDSPVLYYKHSELEDGSEEFLLVIMTEFQKQLLMSSEKKIICLDCPHRQKGGRFYLNCLAIVDESNVAFPIAFCISDKMDASVVKQFLVSVKNSVGALSYKYFMSDVESFYFDAWKEVMGDASQWLWSMWKVDFILKGKLKNYIKVQYRKQRGEIYKTVRTLMECPNQGIFESIFEKFIDSLLVDALEPVKKFGADLMEKFAPHTKLWAYCYRIDTELEANFLLGALSSTLRFCSVEGRKTRLARFIQILMKFLKIKTLDRLKNILDDEKIEMAKETIRLCHRSGLDISSESIASLSDKVFLIRSEEDGDVYVVRDFDSCPELCLLRCDDCNICVHMYSCSCIPSMINANLCQHIHAVVWKFLTPYHFSPIPSPLQDEAMEIDNGEIPQLQKKGSELLDKVMKMSHDIYKSVVENKSNLNEKTLTQVMEKLDEAKYFIDIGSGKKLPLRTEKPLVPTPDFLNRQLHTLPMPIIEENVSQTLTPNVTIRPKPATNALPQKYIILIPKIPPTSTVTKVELLKNKA